MSAFAEALKAVAEGGSLTADQAEAAFAHLMDGDAPDAAVGGFLLALKVRGETADELVGGARALRARALTIEGPRDVVDTCGTGGGYSSFNVSTAAALVAAGAGAKVAKHGNRTVTRKSGSADVLEALGVGLDAPPETASACLTEAGVCFLFAPAHHSAMRHVAKARQALGVRTIFNSLGPLANPAGARRQLVGVNHERLMLPMAEALNALGAIRALVVHGEDGLDEVTTAANTQAVSLRDGVMERLTIRPETLGLERREPDTLMGGGPGDNAAAIRAMLGGSPGALRDIACLNAGAALLVAGRAATLADGLAQAQASVDTGKASAALDALVRVTNAAKEHARG